MIARVSRDYLEQHQVWIYLAGLLLGAGMGMAWPEGSQRLDALLWPALALLLYTTFTQMNLADVPRALQDTWFLLAALAGNFIIIPAAVFGIVSLVPSQDALTLGLLLVLLVPCTDWFITFSSLGRGDAVRASALTPVALFLQLGLLPLYLLLMTDFDLGGVFDIRAVWPAVMVLALPWRPRSSRKPGPHALSLWVRCVSGLGGSCAAAGSGHPVRVCFAHWAGPGASGPAAVGGTRAAGCSSWPRC
ncbi:hypothetical protein [Nesterenkonia pannonica]|uniref:hypothetical protein n=1 Tax=Nesterenkonia pannonica TaxID=1548602 RepID=UPI00216422BF|nr:hypothetical protein [Nesterenkonia pannonica]